MPPDLPDPDRRHKPCPRERATGTRHFDRTELGRMDGRGLCAIDGRVKAMIVRGGRTIDA